MAQKDYTEEAVIEKAMDRRSGESAHGAWTAQSFIIKTLGGNPKTLLIDVMGEDRLGRLALKQGDVRKFWLDVSSRSYVDRNGVERWNTGVRCYDARPIEDAPQTKQEAAKPAAEQQQNAEQQNIQFPPNVPPAKEQPQPAPIDDLPF